MIIYLAASFNSKERMRKIRDRINSDQDQVNSRWIDSDGQGMYAEDIEADKVRAVQGARMDMRDIDQANMVAVFTDAESTSGGLHFEFGYAMGRNKYVVLVGPPVNIFCAHPRVLERFRDEEEFVSWVKSQ